MQLSCKKIPKGWKIAAMFQVLVRAESSAWKRLVGPWLAPSNWKVDTNYMFNIYADRSLLLLSNYWGFNIILGRNIIYKINLKITSSL